MNQKEIIEKILDENYFIIRADDFQEDYEWREFIGKDSLSKFNLIKNK